MWGKNKNRYNDYSYSNWRADENKMKRDFYNYADAKTKKINEDGYEKMGKILGIDIYTDIFLPFFLFRGQSKQLEFLIESEYIQALKKFQCNTLADVKSKIISVREELLDLSSDEFREFYYYLFDINVPGTPNERKKKSIPFELVEVYFNSLFTNQFNIASEFLLYLKEKKVGLKWDEWRMFLDFLQNEGVKFPKDYNVAGNYPVIVDEFYYWYCKKKGIKVPDPEEEGF